MWQWLITLIDVCYHVWQFILPLKVLGINVKDLGSSDSTPRAAIDIEGFIDYQKELCLMVHRYNCMRWAERQFPIITWLAVETPYGVVAVHAYVLKNWTARRRRNIKSLESNTSTEAIRVSIVLRYM